MKLIKNWRQAPKLFSVQAQAVAMAILGTWAAMPDDWKLMINPRVVYGLAIITLVAGVLGRLIDQTPPEDDEGNK